MDFDETLVSTIADSLREKGHDIPRRLDEIAGLPYSAHESLRQDALAGKVHVHRMLGSQNADVFTLLSRSSDKMLQNVYMMMMFGGPIVSLVLCFVQSWLWLIGVVAFPIIGTRSLKRLYNQVILRAALSSELAFCFLYGSGKIAVSSANFSDTYHAGKDA